MPNNHVYLGKLSQIKPTVNYSNHVKALPGQRWLARTIEDCQLAYIISGTAHLILGPNEILLRQGDFAFYGPNSPHQITSSETDPCSFASIHFNWHKDSPEPVHPFSGFHTCTEDQFVIPPQSYSIDVEGYGELLLAHHFSLPNMTSIIMQIEREFILEENGFATLLRGLMTQLLILIIRYQVNSLQSSASRSKITPAITAIGKQPEFSWTTVELADLCGYHPTYFAALFKETTGYTPKQYIIQERIRKAKHYLPGIETVESVAYQLGYTSVHYFCRNFKAVTGLTPTEYKRQSLKL